MKGGSQSTIDLGVRMTSIINFNTVLVIKLLYFSSKFTSILCLLRLGLSSPSPFLLYLLTLGKVLLIRTVGLQEGHGICFCLFPVFCVIPVDVTHEERFFIQGSKNGSFFQPDPVYCFCNILKPSSLFPTP